MSGKVLFTGVAEALVRPWRACRRGRAMAANLPAATSESHRQ